MCICMYICVYACACKFSNMTLNFFAIFSDACNLKQFLNMYIVANDHQGWTKSLTQYDEFIK